MIKFLETSPISLRNLSADLLSKSAKYWIQGNYVTFDLARSAEALGITFLEKNTYHSLKLLIHG